MILSFWRNKKMKKWIIVVLLLLVITLTGCSTAEVLDIPNDEKVRMMQAMEAPVYDAITAKLEVEAEIQGTESFLGNDSGTINATIELFANLDSEEDFYIYITFDIAVASGEDTMTGVGSLYLVDSKLYLDIDYDSKLNGTTSSTDSKEFMDLVDKEINVYSEIQTALAEVNWEEFKATEVATILADSEELFNLITVSTKSDYTYFDADLDQEDIQSLIAEESGTDFAEGISSIKANLTFLKQAFKSLKLEMVYDLTNGTEQVSASGSLIVDLKGKAPTLPSISGYSEVEYFSILQTIFAFGALPVM